MHRILIVDDNADLADTTALLCDTYGFQARIESNAFDILQTIDDFRPTIVLFDIGQPGIDGFEACRLIRASKGRTIRLVSVTGWVDDNEMIRATEAGFDACLVKPVVWNDLLEAMLGQRMLTEP